MKINKQCDIEFYSCQKNLLKILWYKDCIQIPNLCANLLKPLQPNFLITSIIVLLIILKTYVFLEDFFELLSLSFNFFDINN